MKKIHYIVILIVILLIGVCISFVVSIIKSPEYALMKIANYIEASGIDGLMPHLTDEAQETVSAITSITENKLVNSIFSLFGNDAYVGILKSNLEKVEWKLDDILKGDKKANIILAFNYNDKLVGIIEVKMIYENNNWKINGIGVPKFEEINF